MLLDVPHSQEAIQEVVERHSAVQSSLSPDQPPSVDLQALLDSMSEKQERLFENLVHFLQLEVVRLADVLEESERLLGEGPLTTGGYVDQQTQLHRLKVGRHGNICVVVIHVWKCFKFIIG